MGSFKGVVSDMFIYTTTHVITGADVTRKIYDTPRDIALPRIDFHGCSFTYGMGVNDTQTYPYLFAMSNPQYQVRNYGRPGYSTLEALLILKRQKNQNDLPKALMTNNLDFHDQRNAGSAEWREGLQEGFLMDGGRCLSKEYAKTVYSCQFPFGEMADDKLKIKRYGVYGIYHRLWGRHHSALIYAIERSLNKYLYDGTPHALISQAIFLEIQKSCAENKIDLVITVMSSGHSTEDMQKFLTGNHIKWIAVNVDFSNPIYTNQPYDQHPSPLAHHLFAEKIDRALKQKANK